MALATVIHTFLPSWLRTLKARLMLASVLVIAASVLGATSGLLHRVEQRSAEAVIDLEASHMEQLGAMVGQRVVMLQRMMRGAADRMPEAAAPRHHRVHDFAFAPHQPLSRS